MSGNNSQRIHHLRPLREVKATEVESQLSHHLRPISEIKASADRPSFVVHDATGPTQRPDAPSRPSENGSSGLLSVNTAHHDRRLVITPSGELDMSTAGKLEAAIQAAEATDAERIIIDLTEVAFMDSSGLKVLLQAGARARANSNRLRLIRGSRRVQRVFELTHTEEKLPFLD